MQAGLFGLSKALQRFDMTQGSALSSYAVPTMLGEMRRHLRDHTWSVIDPERLGGDAESPSCLPGTEPPFLFAAHTQPSVPDPRFCKGGPRVRCKSSMAGSLAPTAHHPSQPLRESVRQKPTLAPAGALPLKRSRPIIASPRRTSRRKLLLRD